MISNFILSLLLLITSTVAISFELPALPAENNLNRRCFSMYIGKDMLTTGKIQPSPGQNSKINFQVINFLINLKVTDLEGNVYEQRKDIQNEYTFAFTPHNYGDYVFCISSILNNGMSIDFNNKRSITFTLQLGAETKSAEDLAKKEQLKPIEAELQILEQVMQGIVGEMEYLKERELRMRDTNESTNNRVKWFSLFSIVVLISSGIWQIYYLRRFFQSKKIL